MSHEDLKLIIEALGSTTDDAKTVLIAWFAMDVGKVLISWISAVILLGVLVRGITTWISTCNDSETRLRQVRAMFVPGQAGTTVSPSEMARILRSVKPDRE